MSVPKLLKTSCKLQTSENKFEYEQKGEMILLEKSCYGKRHCLIGKRIQKDQITAYNKRHIVYINTAHNLFKRASTTPNLQRKKYQVDGPTKTMPRIFIC